MAFRLSLRQLFRILVVAIVVQAVLGAWFAVARVHGHEYGDGAWVTDLFDLSEECNIPNWYSSAVLLGCALVMVWIAIVERRSKSRYVGHWIGLAAMFGYISMDETAQVHEHLDNVAAFHASGFLVHFAWVIPAAVVVAILGFAYLKFILYLPAKTRFKVILSGIIYVGGALGMEIVLAAWMDTHGLQNVGSALIDALEEIMEILGSSLFLVTLLEYLGDRAGPLNVEIVP